MMCYDDAVDESLESEDIPKDRIGSRWTQLHRDPVIIQDVQFTKWLNQANESIDDPKIGISQLKKNKKKNEIKL